MSGHTGCGGHARHLHSARGWRPPLPTTAAQAAQLGVAMAAVNVGCGANELLFQEGQGGQVWSGQPRGIGSTMDGWDFGVRRWCQKTSGAPSKPVGPATSCWNATPLTLPWIGGPPAGKGKGSNVTQCWRPR